VSEGESLGFPEDCSLTLTVVTSHIHEPNISTASCQAHGERENKLLTALKKKGAMFSVLNSHTEKEFNGTGPAKGTC